MKYVLGILCAFLVLETAFGEDEFIGLAKRTASVFSTVTDIDKNNPHEMTFEMMLTNQKVFLALSATHLNNSFYTLVNSDSALKKLKGKSLVPPEIHVHDFKITLDGLENPTLTCDGSDVTALDVSCGTKKCNLTQRLISACNESDCWITDSSTDRVLTDPVSGSFSLSEKMEISDCIPGNMAGYKHRLGMSVENEAVNILNGGSIQYSLILQNDVYSLNKR